MRFNEWQEFVTYPANSTRVTSREQRLDTSRGVRIGADGHYPPEMFQCPLERRVAVISRSLVVWAGDEFECMEITDFGHVFIWTREKVWFITVEGNRRQIEKLRYVPRNPGQSAGS